MNEMSFEVKCNVEWVSVVESGWVGPGGPTVEPGFVKQCGRRKKEGECEGLG